MGRRQHFLPLLCHIPRRFIAAACAAPAALAIWWGGGTSCTCCATFYVTLPPLPAHVSHQLPSQAGRAQSQLARPLSTFGQVGRITRCHPAAGICQRCWAAACCDTAPTARHAAPSPPDHSAAGRPCRDGQETRSAAALLTISTLPPAHPQPSKPCHRQQHSTQPAHHRHQAPPPWPPPCAPPRTASPAARPLVSVAASGSTIWRLEPQRGGPDKRGCRHTPLPDAFAAAARSTQAGRRPKSPGGTSSPPRCAPRWAAARRRPPPAAARRRRSCLLPAAGAASLGFCPPACPACIASVAMPCT